MARVQVNEGSSKSRLELDRVPVAGDIIALGRNDFVRVREVCLYAPSAPVDAIALAEDYRQNLSAEMEGAVAELDA